MYTVGLILISQIGIGIAQQIIKFEDKPKTMFTSASGALYFRSMLKSAPVLDSRVAVPMQTWIQHMIWLITKRFLMMTPVLLENIPRESDSSRVKKKLWPAYGEDEKACLICILHILQF